MINSVKHVFFDLDHTLWDFDKNSTLAFEMIFEKYNIQINIDSFLSSYRAINMNYWKLYREEKVSQQELRRGRLSDTFARFNKRFSIEIIDQIAMDYISFLPLNNYLIEGTHEILEYLYPKYVLHIITNGFKEVQDKKIISSDLQKYFKTITNSEDAGVKKPNPYIFEYALKAAGALSGSSVMIGDNYEADILGAEALGFQTICFNYHQEKLPVTSCQVSMLKQIKKHL